MVLCHFLFLYLHSFARKRAQTTIEMIVFFCCFQVSDIDLHAVFYRTESESYSVTYTMKCG